jgi:hypothetical protein
MTRHSALADISRLAGYGRGYVFETDCIGSDERSIRNMIASERRITLRTFREAIGTREWRKFQEALGYDRFLPISKAPNVSYWKSTYRGLPAVYARWSGIEYIFARPE